MKNDEKPMLGKYFEELKKNSSVSDDKISNNTDANNEINKINKKIIQREENQKLHLRKKLTDIISGFIKMQIVFFNITVLLIVVSVICELPFLKNIDNDLATLLFDFLKYYIGATIVELLSMLVFILHYVFSKSSNDK